METKVKEAVDGYIDRLLGEKVGHKRKGGKAMLRAWFGLGLLTKRIKKGLYRGYKGRRYRVRKSGGQYVITGLGR
jgi:hypothetical protein